MLKKLLFLSASALLFFVLTASAEAATITMSPGDSFASKIPLLNPGDTLVLQDGIYGMANINCGTNAENGTPSARITIKAENERRAWIRGDGLEAPFLILNCSYWNIEGLRVSSADRAFGRTASIFDGRTANHLIIRRNLFYNGNRYANGSAVVGGINALVEENEVYNFHRNGLYIDNNSIARRNYVNSRGYPDLPGATGGGSGGCTLEHVPGTPRCSSGPGGDSGLLVYPSENSIYENNISELNLGGYDIESAYGSARGNGFFGNISINDALGFIGAARIQNIGVEQMYPDTVVRNHVVISPDSVGMYVRSPKNFVMDGTTVLIDSISSPVGGVIFGPGSGGAFGDGNPTFTASNVLVAGTPPASGFNGGITVDTDVFSTWQISNSNSFTTPSFRPASHANLINPRSIDPQLGPCKVWIPASSPMKGAGAGGKDIGANILYAYENGVQTTKPLWSPTTGEFPHGAIVPGVNDIPGQSLFDIQNRLNVNRNGCNFPTGYSGAWPPGPGVVPTPTPTPEGTLCSQIDSAYTLPPSFGSPYNFFTNPLERTINAYCDAATGGRTAWISKPASIQYHYTYLTGYQWNATLSQWQGFPYTCNVPLTTSGWCPGSATAVLNPANRNFIAYTCSYIGTVPTGSWKCGCRDSACVGGYWQLQRF